MPDTVDARSGGSDSWSLDALARQVLDSIGEGCQVIGPDYRYFHVGPVIAQAHTTKELLIVGGQEARCKARTSRGARDARSPAVRARIG